MEISFKNNKDSVGRGDEMRGEADSQPTNSPRQHKKVELPSRLRYAIVDELYSQHRPACHSTLSACAAQQCDSLWPTGIS